MYTSPWAGGEIHSVEQMWKRKHSPLPGLTGPLQAQSRAAGSQAVKCFHDFLQRGAPPALVSICQVKGGQRVREGKGAQVHYFHGRAERDSPWLKETRFCLFWHRRCFLGESSNQLWEPGRSFSCLQALATLKCKGPGVMAP